MLLIFDQVHYLDPVDDDTWRARLMRQMEDVHSPQFKSYREIADALPTLIEEQIVIREDPTTLAALADSSLAMSAIADLRDQVWAKLASRPERHHMPHRRRNGVASWEIFRPKLPDDFVAALESNADLQHHLLSRGRDSESWQLTYEAGSAISIAAHLAAAEELGIAPVTDSDMHHALLLTKVSRSSALTAAESPLPGNRVRQMANNTAMSLLSDVLPRHALEQVSFDSVLEFRQRTQLQRRQFVSELYSRVGAASKATGASEQARVTQELRVGMAKEVREYRAELMAVRDKLWPTLIGSLSSTAPAGTAAAVALAYIGNLQYAASAAAVAAGLSVLKGALDLRAEDRRVRTRSAPGIAYLSAVRDTLGSR